MELALLSGHREVEQLRRRRAASRASSARNIVRRNDGRRETLPGCAQTVLEAGEAIEIVTPTGGGWGRKS